MLRMMLRVQWVRVRVGVILCAILLVALPLLMIRAGGGPDGEIGGAGWWLRNAEGIGKAIPVIALFLGLYLGLTAWSDDVKGGHVYALSLPIARERYVLYRFLATAAPLLVPAAGLLAGSLIAIAAVNLPLGVHSYPFALALRMLMASLVSYAIFFAIAVATRRAVLLVLGTIVVLVAADLIIGLFEVQPMVIETAVDILTTWPGPLAILLGRWALFDV